MTDATDVLQCETSSISPCETESAVPVQSGKQPKPWQFKPGQSGNPLGRPKGSRNKLAEDFVGALYDDFKQHGVQAIEATRKSSPETYVKVIAGLLPKEVKIERPLQGLSDDELHTAIATLQAMLAGAVIEGEPCRVLDATDAQQVTDTNP